MNKGLCTFDVGVPVVGVRKHRKFARQDRKLRLVDTFAEYIAVSNVYVSGSMHHATCVAQRVAATHSESVVAIFGR